MSEVHDVKMSIVHGCDILMTTLHLHDRKTRYDQIDETKNLYYLDIESLMQTDYVSDTTHQCRIYFIYARLNHFVITIPLKGYTCSHYR